MGIINDIFNGIRFKDTIFYKESSDLNDKYKALKKLNNEYPNNDNLISELYTVKKGLDGENEIAYQLKKSHIGMYVLRDIQIKFKDLTAQIDYVIITPVYTYFIECKNLVGNITVNENGDFIREFTVNGKKIKKGMYSPLRQVEAQREVARKIWEDSANKFQKMFGSNLFDYYRRVLVVAANQDTILNTQKAPKDIKDKIIRADNLIRKITYDINNRNKEDSLKSQKTMEEAAKSYIDGIINEKVDYYKYYKDKFCNNNKITYDNTLKERLIEFRKDKSKSMNIPAYYVFTNEELDKLIEIKPRNMEDLIKSNILSKVKLKTHGEDIIKAINDR